MIRSDSKTYYKLDLVTRIQFVNINNSELVLRSFRFDKFIHLLPAVSQNSRWDLAFALVDCLVYVYEVVSFQNSSNYIAAAFAECEFFADCLLCLPRAAQK